MDFDDHPLLVELDSLRETAARFQHEAHVAAIKLQRHSLESSRIYEHAAALEQENDRLVHEIDALRAHPDTQQHPAVAQVQELSLALRRVSDKITLTENTLIERTSELVHTRTELNKTRHAADGAFELAARMRAREEASKARERELERMVHAAEEECKMVDLVVKEYADLVRNLEGRKSACAPSTTTTTVPIDTLQDSKSNLERIVTAFSAEAENLHTTIAELNAKISDLQMTLDLERMATKEDRTSLSRTMTELDKLNLEDQTAAKMVARYMKFSQASTNALQEQITTIKTRHAATIATMELQLSVVESQLASERVRTARLQDALDELCEDLARESYGRRREVSLRLALLSREEGVAEFMRRWARRARELYARCYNSAEASTLHEDAIQDAFYRVVSDAESILSTLDDDLEFSDATCLSGSMARIALSRTAVDALRSELQDEVQKRIEAVRRSALSLPNGHEDHAGSESPPDQPPLTPNGVSEMVHEALPPELPHPRVMDSPLSVAAAPDASIEDPFVVTAPAPPPGAETTDHSIEHAISSRSITQDSASTSTTLLVEEEHKSVQSQSPAVSILDFPEYLQPFCTEQLPTIDVAPIRALPSDASLSGVLVEPEFHSVEDTPDFPLEHPTAVHTPASDAQILVADNLSTLVTTPIPAAAPSLPSSAKEPPALLSELGTAKHRYDALQRAFRDCSHALRELKRTVPSSPSPHTQTKLWRHLETALARIDDFAEDARVELEIRVADEELTLRGFEMMFSVPGVLDDADERAEAEMNARAFVDGTDEGVARALEKFTRKLEDIQHDVAVVKRAVHGLASQEAEAVVDESEEARGDGGGWTAWTAGLLGGGTTPTRSSTPVETFGVVMTSPRLRHAASLKTLHGQEGQTDPGPLAALGLRIPMPVVSPVQTLGVGHSMERETRPRTLSAMYAVGGLRSASSLGLGVGLGGSASPARTRGTSMFGIGSPLQDRDGSVEQDVE